MIQESIKQHLQRIVDNIGAINQSIHGMHLNDFVRNEQVKEAVYEYLEEIGQAAREIQDHNDLQDLPEDFGIEQLVRFRNARYNQEAETGHQQVFAYLTEDLQDIADTIENSSFFQSQEL
jgi:uncharacterized protein with HEPN domain